MEKRQLLYLISMLLFMGGCYTQFTTLQDRYYEPPRTIKPPCDSCAAEADSAGALAAAKDTVNVKERETCYWEQNFFGEWRLRCYSTNYPDYHHRYYNRPWWYTGYYSSLNDPYECHCPYHVFYHPSCEYCWYYCDRYSHMWNNNNNNINDTTGHISSGSTGQVPTIPAKKGSIKSGGGPNSGSTVIIPKPQQKTPSYIPSVPVKKPVDGQGTTNKKPDENISGNSGKVPVNTGSNQNKPASGEPKKRRFGRGR